MYPFINLVGRYGHDQIELEGDSQSLLWLSEQLMTGKDYILSLSRPKEVNAEPYEVFLKLMRIQVSEGALKISKKGSELQVSGAPKNLTLLAKSVKRLAGQKNSKLPRPHTHIEYFPEHPFLSSSSMALIIALDD